MQARYNFPSGTYILKLSEEERMALINGDDIFVQVGRIPCSTGRGVYDPEKNAIVAHDEKDIYNNLQFATYEDVADMKAGIHNVQFLVICTK